jgi:hypothetical protein
MEGRLLDSEGFAAVRVLRTPADVATFAIRRVADLDSAAAPESRILPANPVSDRPPGERREAEGRPMAAGDSGELSTKDALRQWREAERAVAVARRGKVAAQAAVDAANDAAEAAAATADAAKAALAASTLAETSAAKGAMAARLAVQASIADHADAESETALAEVEEAAAHARYQGAVERATAVERDGSKKR